MLPRSHRLSRADFARFRKAQTLSCPLGQLRYIAANKEIERFAVVIAKKIVPKAVTRHRLKRQIMAAIMQTLKQTNNTQRKPILGIVYVVKPIITLTPAQIVIQVHELLQLTSTHPNR